MTGGGIQIGVPTIVESTGGGGKGEQKESARTGQSVVGGGGLVGRQFHEHVFYSSGWSGNFALLKNGEGLQIKFDEAPNEVTKMEHVLINGQWT